MLRNWLLVASVFMGESSRRLAIPCMAGFWRLNQTRRYASLFPHKAQPVESNRRLESRMGESNAFSHIFEDCYRCFTCEFGYVVLRSGVVKRRYLGHFFYGDVDC